MERTVGLILFFTFLFSSAPAQQTHKEVIYESFISGNMSKWKKEMDKMQQSTSKTNKFRLELINYQIGYIGWCIGMEKEDEAEKYIKSAGKHLDFLKKKKYKLSYVNSYRGAIDGFRIGLNVFLAPFIGPGILDKAQKAIELDKNNPDAYILTANSKYYMWAVMGGSKETALKYYHKAEKIIEDENLEEQNWNYLSLLTMIAHAYEEIEDYDKALNYYKKILKTEPDYTWVKDELLPKLEKKIKKTTI